MNITNMSIFLFCILTMAGAFEASVPSIFGGSNPISSTNMTEYVPNATEIEGMVNVYGANSSAEWWSVEYYQAMVQGSVAWVTGGLNLLGRLFAPSLNVGSWLHGMLPFLPAEFCGGLTLITWVIYVVGIVQFVSGRSEKMMR